MEILSQIDNDSHGLVSWLHQNNGEIVIASAAGRSAHPCQHSIWGKCRAVLSCMKRMFLLLRFSSIRNQQQLDLNQLCSRE